MSGLKRKDFPNKIAFLIPEKETVRYACRRNKWEVVPEVGDGILWTGIILCAAWFVQGWPVFNSEWFWPGVILMLIYPIGQALVELYLWWGEVFVVTSSMEASGGYVYRFSGWASNKEQLDPITSSSPAYQSWTPSPVILWMMWEKMTGDRILRVDLRTQNHTYISGSLMPAEFTKAIEKARREGPTQIEEAKIGDLTAVYPVSHLMDSGKISDKDGKFYLAKILSRALLEE